MVVNALRNVTLRRHGTERLPGAGVDPDSGEVIGPVERPAPREVPAPPTTGPATVTSDAPDELPLEDYTWTHFWRWARGHDLTTKARVEQRLGHSIDGLTPAEVRVELKKLGIPL